MKGKLFVCATPIGNLEDASRRLIRVLGEVDLIAAEDTRHTRKLLSHFAIGGKLISYHDANEHVAVRRIVEELKSGKSVALVSDSGMPAISDPGYSLIVAAIEAGMGVEVIPGPSSVLAALVASGLPTARFAFEGFLSRKQGERRKRLQALAGDERTLILFEAPGRLVATLEDLAAAFGDRRAAVARELTKVFEQVVRGTLSHLLDEFSGEQVKGEVVIVVEGASASAGDLEDAVALAGRLEAGGESKSRAAARAASEFGVNRRQVYERLVAED